MTDTGNSKSNSKKTGTVNVGKLIFGAVLIYLIAMMALYLTKERITSYEVMMGKLSRSITTTGVVLRDETIYYADASGNVTFYASEGDKVRVGSNLYSIGSTISATSSDNDSESHTLEADDYSYLAEAVYEFQDSYDPQSFDRTYDFSYLLESELLDVYNRHMLDRLTETGSNVAVTKASDDGIIGYTIDGYEGLTLDQINDSVFDKKEYNKKDIREDAEIHSGDPIYKLVTRETWSLVIPVKEDDYRDLEASQITEMEVRFEKDNMLLWATPTYMEENGRYYICLTFVNSMLRYLSDRYLDVTLVINEDKGLKIPNTAITEKPFYLIPEEYIHSTNGSADSVYIKDEDSSVMKKNISIYYMEPLAAEQAESQTTSSGEDSSGNTSSEGTESGEAAASDSSRMCYIDCSALEEGTQLIKPDSLETYTVSKTGTLKGVYCINKGYAVFKHIEESYVGDEYTIVKEGTSYGISNYDFIALDSTTVREDDIVY